MVTVTRETVGFALLLSVPPGVGVGKFVSEVTGAAVTPTGVAAGAATTLGLFAFVVVAASVGENARDERGE
jgi:hypothetical protein